MAFNFNEDDGEYRESCTNFPTNVPFRRRLIIPNDVLYSPQRSLASPCVTDCIELRSRSRAGECTRTSSKKPCRIDVCKKSIKCSRKTARAIDDGPIDLSNKDIIFNCILDCPSDRCELDGGGDTQLFSGSNLSVAFTKFNFTNSFGSAIQIFGGGGFGRTVENSILSLSECSFVNNSATSGSAISVNYTDVFMEGSTTSFINNMGNGVPIDIFSSDVTLSEAYFEGNSISKFGRGVLVYDSTMNLGNVSFAKTTSSRRRYLVENLGSDCDMYVAVDIKNFDKKGSCLTSSETITKSKPVICPPIIAPNAPTPPKPAVPTPTPPTRPPCFSALNIVEVKDVGSMQMDQLQIGDFVKSGNGQFTQVYGFGHLDPAREEVFLQIHFHSKGSQTDIILPLPLEVSARHLVMLDKVGFQFPTRAADVVVGDMLNGRRVAKIQNVARLGVYAPLTQSGDLIVSGICASNYVDVLNESWGWNQHVLGHMIFFSQRIFCSYFIETCKEEGYINGYGYLSYLVVLVGSVINRYRPCVSIIVSSFIMIYIVVNGILSGSCYALAFVCILATTN